MNPEVKFPLTVRFEDGEEEQYENVEELECNLEDFDSDTDTLCQVWDALKRPVHLKLRLLTLKELSLSNCVKASMSHQSDAAKETA